MNKLSFALLLTLFVAGCKEQRKLALPYYSTPNFTPIWLAPNQLDKVHTIPTFSFTDQEARTVNSATVKGKIYAVNFFFTACGSVCPKMTGNLQVVQQAFMADTNVLILSHTVTPDLDSLPALKAYAAKNHIQHKNWRLLTGDKDIIYRLARQAYFADEQQGFYKGSDDFLHTENVVLIDRQSHIRGVYNGTLQLEIKKLVEDIKTLKNEGLNRAD